VSDNGPAATLPPRLASVFRLLRSGRHLSREDDADFLDLDRNAEQYSHLLSGLGYQLRCHPQGFYYLEGSGAVRADRMRAALVFLLILFQDLDEKKFQSEDRAWERTLLRRSFRIAELPHFHTAQRRAMMSAVDIDEVGLTRVLQFLERLGVVQLLPEGQFGFLAPVHRFTKLNSAMRRHRVSNLREVQLEVVRQHEACDLLESLTGPDGLFADREALDRARDRLRRWIKEGKIIRLDDLFAVRIRVQGVDGQWGEAKSLDDIGSTGTGMTAKAMIFIHLVRAVVADERYRLHFYLDETGQLDDSNLAATTALAMERGVVPITAEPRIRVEPLAHPTVTVYSLGQDSEGQFYIDARRTLRAAMRQAEQEPTADVAGSA
jgi:chromosome condensin MukBEF MukE localization factor